MAFGEYSGEHFWQSSTYSETRYLWNWKEGIVAQTTHSRPSWSINPQPFPFYFTAPLGYGGVFYGSNAPLRYTVSESFGSVGSGQSATLLEVDPYLSSASTSYRFALPENAPERGARATDIRAKFSRHWESSYEEPHIFYHVDHPVVDHWDEHEVLDEEYVTMSPYGEYKVLRDNQGDYHRVPGAVPLPSGHVALAVNARGQILSVQGGESYLNGTKVSDTGFFGINGWEDPVLWHSRRIGFRGNTTWLGENGVIVGVDTPPEESDSPLVIATEEGVYVPLPDLRENAGFLPPSSRANLTYVSYAELVRDTLQDGSPKWTGYEAAKMTDNGMIAARAINSETGQPHAVLLLKVDVVPDFNRDGTIDDSDRSQVTDTNPFRWWLNDDDDVNEDTGLKDAPGDGTADSSNAVVDSERDLIDFFPVFIDLKSLLDSVDDVSTLTVKLKHADDGLKFVYTDLLPGSVKAYWHDNGLTTGYGSDFTDGPGEADTIAVTSAGAELSEAFLNKMKNEDKGVILLEGAGTSDSTEPLVLEVSNSSGTLFEFEMPLSLSPVTDMFRHVNLADRAGAGTSERTPDDKGTPTNYPDTLTSNKSFAFVHGYNVSQEQAQGWHCEIFKRMHRMGSKAKFIGVTWDGDTSPDYHQAVFRAFKTSQHLNSELSDFPNLTIAAHSLGNMVVSSAIEDWSLSPDNYYLLNAAVALEAYNSAQTITNMRLYMTENDWKDYLPDDRLFTSHWYRLFDSTDVRSELTWKNRFETVRDIAFNFYSPGEDVVENANPSESFGLYVWNTLKNLLSGQYLGRHAWVSQEIAKGSPVTDIPGGFANVHGGWSFNGNQSDLEQVGILKSFPADTDSYRPRLPSETSSTVPTDEQLAQFGFFKRFDQMDVYGPIDDANSLPGNDQTQAGASTEAQKNEVQWHLLAEAIPAMSYAAAANSVQGMQENFNMEDQGRSGWPATRGGNNDWIHSDFKNISLNYVTPMYQRMIDIGGLDND